MKLTYPADRTSLMAMSVEMPAVWADSPKEVAVAQSELPDDAAAVLSAVTSHGYWRR